MFEIRGMKIRRVLPTTGWMSDKMRKLVDSFDRMRLVSPRSWVWEENQTHELNWEEIEKRLKSFFEVLYSLEKRKPGRDENIKKKGKRNEFLKKELESSFCRLKEYEKSKRRNYEYKLASLQKKKQICG